MITANEYADEKSASMYKKMLLFLVAFVVFIFGFNIKQTKSIADTTSVQSIPMMNTGKSATNSANAVQNFGGSLEESISNVSGNSNKVEHNIDTSNDSDSNADPADTVLQSVFGTSKEGVSYDRNARFSDVFKIENRLGHDLINAILKFGDYVAVGMFLVGMIMLLFGVVRSHAPGRWSGLTVMIISALVLVALTNLPRIYAWIIGYGHQLLA